METFLPVPAYRDEQKPPYCPTDLKKLPRLRELFQVLPVFSAYTFSPVFFS